MTLYLRDKNKKVQFNRILKGVVSLSNPFIVIITKIPFKLKFINLEIIYKFLMYIQRGMSFIET